MGIVLVYLGPTCSVWNREILLMVPEKKKPEQWQEWKRRCRVSGSVNMSAVMWRLNTSLSVFLSCRVYELCQLHWHEQQNRCDWIKGTEDPPSSLWIIWGLAFYKHLYSEDLLKCRLVWNLLLFQIRLLEETRSSLPTVNSLPEGSTDNEVDAPQPTPIGPPSYLPPGADTPHENVPSEIWRWDVEELFLFLITCLN